MDVITIMKTRYKKLNIPHMLKLITSYHRALSVLGFPVDSDGKESACNAGDPALIPGTGRFPLLWYQV